MTVDDLYEIAHASNYYVYGAGKIADRFLRLMRENNLLSNCLAVVTTSSNLSNNVFNGYELKNVNDIEKGNWIFIATNTTSYNEIKNVLDQMGVKKYLWVFPIMFDLAFGRPLVCNAELEVKSLIKQMSCKSWIAICYLALEDFFVGNGYGKDFYIRFAENRFPLDVAEKDLERFMCWAEDMKNGYQQEYNIKINHDRILMIDGAHRVALARYFNVDKIFADIYQCTDEMYQDFRGSSESIINLDEKYVCNKFSDTEIEIIHDTARKIAI